MRSFFFLISFILMFPPKTTAQIFDDFGEERLDTSVWKGDTDDFILDNGRLRLNVQSEKSTSVLFTHYSIRNTNVRWQLDIELDFSPSNQNRLFVWLYANSDDFESADGYFFSIGENGSTDAIKFFKKSEGQTISLAEGASGKVASNPFLSIIISKDSISNWRIDVLYDDNTSETFFFQDSEFDISEGIFALVCNYTGTRRDKFFFDNIQIGVPDKDDIPPSLISHELVPGGIELNFSESINLDKVTIDQFRFIPDFDIINVLSPTSKSIRLEGDSEFTQATEYQLIIDRIEDFNGNKLDTSITFFVPYQPTEGELLINEILFNPRGSGADFVEIINISTKELWLFNVYIENVSKNEEEKIRTPELIAPGEILVFTDDKENIITSFDSHDALKIFEQDIPAFNNTSGNVTIAVNQNDQRIAADVFDYSDDFHIQLLDNEDGVSLERISTEKSTQNAANWTSASSISGFGTPGLPNSNSLNNPGQESIKINVVNKVFSPNGDGDDDFAEINYEFEASHLGNATIYDLNGNPVKSIWRNETTGTEGVLRWDGRNDNGEVQSIGIYIIVLEIFDLEGQVSRFKKELVLADFLD